MRIINNVVIVSNGSNYKFVDIRGLSVENTNVFLMVSYLSKIINKNFQPFPSDEIIVLPCSIVSAPYFADKSDFCIPIAVCYNPDALVVDLLNGTPNMMRTEDILIGELGQEMYDSLTQITEEQFYDLTLPTE